MPPGGAGVRAEQLATLNRVSHEALTSDEMGRLLDKLAGLRGVAAVRLVRGEPDPARSSRLGEGAPRARPSCAARCRAPPRSRCPSGSRRGRTRTSRSSCRPCATNFELRRRYVECFDDYDEPYDVLLDDFEPGMKTAEVRAVFERLKEEQVPLVAASRAEGERPVGGASFPIDRQKVFELKVIERFGFDPSEWRLDTAVHPFASSIAITRHPPDDALLRGQPRRALRDDARVRPRAVRARRRPRARAHAARARRLARPARVAEPHVGEHGRPQPAVLAPLLPAAARARSRRRSAASGSRTGTGPSTGSSRR